MSYYIEKCDYIATFKWELEGLWLCLSQQLFTLYAISDKRSLFGSVLWVHSVVTRIQALSFSTSQVGMITKCHLNWIYY